LITSLTTLLVILILFVFGGEGLKGFTFALLVGVAVGTYSSVCVATPIVVDFMNRFKK
jgi:SecD/SecF fusion protein